MVYFINTLQSGAIYEMDFATADAFRMLLERIEGSNFGDKFGDIGKSRETAPPPICAFFGGLRM